jgi:nicotinic acid mononucleotide adenylyltransferase
VLRRNNDWEEVIKPVTKYLSGLIVVNRLPGQDGIDMLVVGDDRTKKLTRWAEVVEKRQGRPMNYVIMDREDYLYRKSVRDRFINELLEMEITELYDPEGMIKG